VQDQDESPQSRPQPDEMPLRLTPFDGVLEASGTVLGHGLVSKSRGYKPISFPPANEHPDTGCGGLCVASLDCPFPMCRADDPAAALAFEKAMLEGEPSTSKEQLHERYRQYDAAWRKGRSYTRVARMFGVSVPTVTKAVDWCSEQEGIFSVNQR